MVFDFEGVYDCQIVFTKFINVYKVYLRSFTSPAAPGKSVH